mmetsp:Transcript_26432/g.79270  ORF Transcript_26432/g.79270 Transcript_26432/m.79270 type:complete len:325 (+) Transcript_26432:208-1182(+)|eukprot:CAMPEP_0119269772 /NCGR_PEP_ID=MMETSP1329-20130426/7040_1 /TAXON_ID=114041 /ORGANISM="Genus nov. species nov., Strain RCC1024" /LENGTH=324 /DNA_ID=CAMNT_0007269773 /DNA_START=179 /DNA_END=1153 /DNA_ORIENTATION=-
MLLRRALLLRRPGLAAARRRLADEKKAFDAFDAAATEKKLGELQRSVRSLLAQHAIEDATRASEELVALAREAYGDDRNPILAAACNDEALCRKAGGDFEKAAELFARASQLYGSCGMTNHASSATALHNLGACYKDQAMTARGLDRAALLDRASEALDESQRRRTESPGFDAARDGPSLASTKVIRASVLRLLGDAAGATAELEAAIADLRAVEAPTAMIQTALAAALNNQALYAKQDGDPDGLAGPLYTEALKLREDALGPAHPLVVQTLHNLAEHLDARGDSEDAYDVRQDILRRLEVDEDEADASFKDAARAFVERKEGA